MDFDSDDDFDLDGFDNDFGDLDNKGSLGDLWRNNPFVKIGIILVVIAILIGIFMLFTGKETKKPPSQMSGGSEVSQTPGMETVSEDYRQRIQDVNTNNLETALRENESTVPMPVEAPKGVIPLELDKPDEIDPLEKWRIMQEGKVERAVKNQTKAVEVDEPEVDTKTPAIEALSQAMSTQMASILGNQTISGVQTRAIAQLDYLEGLQTKLDEKLEDERSKRSEQQNNQFFNDNRDSAAEILLPAGTIEYAQLITEANTDVPGPILAEIMTGPFKGGRLIGTFEETYNYLTLNFNTIVLDGVDYSAEGVAIDPDTTLPGMATDINRRYFARVVLPIAAEFITGVASAVADSGNTSITISGDTVTESTSNTRTEDQEVALGISKAGEELGEIINEIKDNYPQLIRVRAGTPMGILFVSAVTDNQNNENGGDIIGPYRPLNSSAINSNATTQSQ